MTARALVLAGERPGSALAAELGVPAAVLAEVGGTPMLYRVLASIRASQSVQPGVVVGPDAAVLANTATAAAIAAAGFSWLAPAAGPAASAAAGVAAMQVADAQGPLLVTTADHALLTPQLVDTFMQAALASGADFAVGLAHHSAAEAALPGTRRTALRFADGHLCGCNLFAVLTPAGARVFAPWQRVEAQRKTPWRVVSLLGVGTVLRYLAGRLTLARACARLGLLAGCTIAPVLLEDGLAAVDVDSRLDWQQVNAWLAQRAAG